MIFAASWYKTIAFTCHILSFEEHTDKIIIRTEKELKYSEEKLKDGKIR